MDIRRFYVMSPRGEQGPFSVVELNEELSAGRITPLEQVRTGMGTMIGTVREVLIAPEALWNTAESGTGLNAVAVSQRRTRMISLAVLGLTLVPALSLILLLGGREDNTHQLVSNPTTPVGKSETPPSVTMPPTSTVASIPVPTPSAPSPRPASAATRPAPATLIEATTGTGLVQQETNGVLTLMASSAIITSKGARLQGKGGDSPHIGTWNDKNGGLEWQTVITRPGKFRVVITYACNRSGAGAILKLATGDGFINGIVQDTGSWDIYKPYTLAQPVTIATRGPVTISLSPQEKKSSAFMKLIGIVLTPVDSPR